MSLLTDPTVATHWELAREAARPIRLGTVRRVLGNGFEVAGLDAAIGDLVVVATAKEPLSGLVVALHDDCVVVSAYGELDGLRCGRLASTPILR